MINVNLWSVSTSAAKHQKQKHRQTPKQNETNQKEHEIHQSNDATQTTYEINEWTNDRPDETRIKQNKKRLRTSKRDGQRKLY